MTRYRTLATASVWAALLAGCGTLKTRTDASFPLFVSDSHQSSC